MQCPTCRRTIAAEECCPRCGTDLRGVLMLVKIADQYIRAGKNALQVQDFVKAFSDFKNAYSLDHSSLSGKGMIVSLFCLGKNNMALKRIMKLDALKNLFLAVKQ